MVVFNTEIRQWSEDKASLLSAFAGQASLVLDKARSLNEGEREKEHSDALYRVSNLLAGAHDTDEVLPPIVNEAAQLVGAIEAWIRVFAGESLILEAGTEALSGQGTIKLKVSCDESDGQEWINFAVAIRASA